jgi:hypothetical protein
MTRFQWNAGSGAFNDPTNWYDDATGGNSIEPG